MPTELFPRLLIHFIEDAMGENVGEFSSTACVGSFVTLWHNFLDSASREKSDQVFQELIAKHFTITQTAAASPVPPLTYEEANVLLYVADYVCQKVKNIEASTHPH